MALVEQTPVAARVPEDDDNNNNNTIDKGNSNADDHDDDHTGLPASSFDEYGDESEPQGEQHTGDPDGASCRAPEEKSEEEQALVHPVADHHDHLHKQHKLRRSASEEALHAFVERSLHVGVEKGSEAVLTRSESFLARAIVESGRGVAVTGLAATRALRRLGAVLHFAIPLVGALLVAHMTWHDLARARHEAKRGAILVAGLFVAAGLCDGLDVLVHVVALYAHAAPHAVHHHALETAEHAGAFATVAAVAALVAAELLAGEREKTPNTTTTTTTTTTTKRALPRTRAAKPKLD